MALCGQLNLSGFNVFVSRDSVSAGDDALGPHHLSLKLKFDATIEDLFSKVFAKRILAKVSGEQHCWTAHIEGESIATFNGNSKNAISEDRFSERVEAFQDKGLISVYFRYFSSAT